MAKAWYQWFSGYFKPRLLPFTYQIRIKLNLEIKDAMLMNSEDINGCIYLDNNCRSGTVEFSVKLWKRIGKPSHVILVHNEKEIFILNR